MFENICTLPLTSNFTVQALHPTLPLLAVGLAAGHVQTFRLPPADGHNPTGPRQLSPHNGYVGAKPARRTSDGGVGTIDTAWRTRRHKGSCRALTYSCDGEALYSGGVDGIVKAASAETGRVFAKVLMPRDGGAGAEEEPMVMQALSPQALLLATDMGRLHVYDLRANVSGAEGVGSRPQRTLRPHEEEDATMAIESLAVLSPSTASTSGTARQWITTAGGTVAACDLRKGVLGCSRDQGDVLSCCAVVSTGTEGAKRRKVGGGAAAGAAETVVVGSSDGMLSFFDRGEWNDHKDRLRFGSQDIAIECMAAAPESVLEGPGTIAIGAEDGRVTFQTIAAGRRKTGTRISHDETGVEGVVAVGFDVAGRMITGGGEIVKVWFDNGLKPDTEWPGGVGNGDEEDDDDDDDDDDDEDGEEVEDSDEDEDESDEESEEEQRSRPSKKQKKGGRNGGFGDHGIAAFEGMT